MPKVTIVTALVWIMSIVPGCTHGPQSAAPMPSAGRSVVLWISIDGMRHDYIRRDAERLPTFSRLIRDGAHTEALMPVFPSLTFPSHVSEATGVPAGKHGIVSNSFYDVRSNQLYKMPTPSALLEAEPIWITAPRQGVRTAVVDWPLSYQQEGSARSDYFAQGFSKDSNDEQRLDSLLKIWRDDDPAAHGGKPLRLLMGYIADVDHAGHKYGPDSQGLRDQLVETDRLIGNFLESAQGIFRSKMSAGDRLYILITTDHGMSPVQNLASFEHIVGAELLSSVKYVTNGSLANVYLDEVPESDRAARQTEILSKLRKWPFVEAWSRGELPKRYGYDNPRSGDVIASLRPGYTWSRKPSGTTQPATPDGQLGMHGYPVEEDPNMQGFAAIVAVGKNLGGSDLGRVDSLRFHPTVAKILGIHPASDAQGAPIVFEK